MGSKLKMDFIERIARGKSNMSTWERYSEVNAILANAHKSKLWDELQMCAKYHNINYRRAIDEALHLWNKENDYETKEPRFLTRKGAMYDESRQD